jgi:uncharacterized membrane protein
MSRFISGLIWFAIVGCGCIGGVFFAFSTFIMASLERIGTASGAAAMNSINSVILGSLFMPVFYGTTLASLVLAAGSLSRWREPGAPTLAVAGIVYVLGMFGVTLFLNVPLNNALAAAASGTPESAAVWARYLKEWTLWNHVRTLASLGAATLFIVALRARI